MDSLKLRLQNENISCKGSPMLVICLLALRPVLTPPLQTTPHHSLALCLLANLANRNTGRGLYSSCKKEGETSQSLFSSHCFGWCLHRGLPPLGLLLSPGSRFLCGPAPPSSSSEVSASSDAAESWAAGPSSSLSLWP